MTDLAKGAMMANTREYSRLRESSLFCPACGSDRTYTDERDEVDGCTDCGARFAWSPGRLTIDTGGMGDVLAVAP